MSELRIDVRWRPEGAAVNDNYDKSFQGSKAEAIAEALAHIERNFLTLRTIKHPDRAESTRFWNFNLSEIQAALGKLTGDVGSKRDAIFRVDIGYQAVIISAESWPVVRVQAHPLLKPHRTDFSSVSAE